MIANIIPSVRLKVITIHKMQDLSCQRYYYWRWVRNLEPRKMNINFWYGSVLHRGFETLLMKGLSKALVAMDKESRAKISRHNLDGDETQECVIQLALLKTIITAASRQPFMKYLSMQASEQRCQTKLNSDLVFCSTIDGTGRYKNEPVMFEIKTAKSVNNDYFTALALDQQIYGYGLQLKASGIPVSKVAYCVFRKSGKYIKRGQSAEQFIAEIKQDIKERPEWYFIVDSTQKVFPYIITLGSNTLQDTQADIITTGHWLAEKYKNKEILNKDYWPKNCKHCLAYGACQFLPLCKNIRKYELYLRLYQQREMLYEAEKTELLTK